MKGRPCQHDCEYYSRETKTCDYRLIMFKGRTGPVTACESYEKGDRVRRHVRLDEWELGAIEDDD